MVEGKVLELSVETVEAAELGLGPAVRLALVVNLLRHLVFQHLGRLRPLQNLVLTVAEDSFKNVLADGEADNQLLPREQRAVEEPREALDNDNG